MSIINTLFFDSLDSTNTYAKNNADSLPLPSLIIADEQTAGRGRRGNSFFSPKDTGLYMTLVFESPESCDLLTPKAAVAVCRILEKYNIEPKIKWVNDIFVNSKKVCGILAERFLVNGKPIVATGIGINLTTSDFPNELPSAGSINLVCDKKALAKEIAEELFSDISDKKIISAYKERLFILGKEIVYQQNGINHSAVAVDINESCNLIVKHSDGSFETLFSGEISIKI